VMDANHRMIDVFADSGLPIVERVSRLGVTHLVLSVANLGPPRWETTSLISCGREGSS
jgi:hypothetical protein